MLYRGCQPSFTFCLLVADAKRSDQRIHQWPTDKQLEQPRCHRADPLLSHSVSEGIDEVTKPQQLVVDDVVGLSVSFTLDGQSVGSSQVVDVNDTPVILAFAKDTQLPFLQCVVEGLLEQPTRPIDKAREEKNDTQVLFPREREKLLHHLCMCLT